MCVLGYLQPEWFDSGYFMSLFRDCFHRAEHAQEVAAPDLRDLFVGVTATQQLACHVQCVAGILETLDARAVIEVRADADVIRTDALGHVVDLVDQVLHRRAAHCCGDLLVEGGLTFLGQRRIAVIGAHARGDLGGQAVLGADRANALLRLRRNTAQVGVEGRDLHGSAILLDGIQLGVGEIAGVLHQRPHTGVAGNHRRARQLQHLLQTGGRELRHVHDDAELVELAGSPACPAVRVRRAPATGRRWVARNRPSHCAPHG